MDSTPSFQNWAFQYFSWSEFKLDISAHLSVIQLLNVFEGKGFLSFQHAKMFQSCDLVLTVDLYQSPWKTSH